MEPSDQQRRRPGRGDAATSASGDPISLTDDPFGEDEDTTAEGPLLPETAPLATDTEPLGFNDPFDEEAGETAEVPVADPPAKPRREKRSRRLLHIERVEEVSSEPAKVEKPAKVTKVKPAKVEKPAKVKPTKVAKVKTAKPSYFAQLRATVAAARAEQKQETPAVPPEEAVWAGLDLEPPRHSRRQQTDRVVLDVQNVDEEDEFTALVTPLSGPELQQLQAYVSADDVLFKRVEAARQTEAGRYGFGLLLSLSLLTLLARFYGRAYLDGLVHATAPRLLGHLSFLSPLLGADYASALYAGVGFLAPFLLIAIVTDGTVSALRARADRSLAEASLALTAAAFAVAAAALLAAVHPVQAIGLALSWKAIRAVTLRILHPRGRR